ncbi:MAG: hypothetical protein JOY54_08015 [Acidobacteriaceae bacterium]|nr:hypothetical protein [Acidobacteriaceae bacterium]
MSIRRSSAPRITRRQLTALLGASPLLAQVASTAPPQSPATPQERLQKAYADVRGISNRLATIEVPIFVHPAFAFRP